MQWWQAILLGAIQGITEFLPISSDGHLVLARSLLNVTELTLSFDIMVHAGTLVVMVAYFHRQLRALQVRDWIHLGIATLPAVITGVGIRSSLVALQQSPYVVAASFFITAFFVWLADALWQPRAIPLPFATLNLLVEKVESWHRKWRHPDRVSVTIWQALGVGLFQALAVLPGLSRSGSTLLGGAVVGLKREDAFPFAFLVGVPTIFGALMYDLLALYGEGNLITQPWGMYALGAVAAGVSGWLSLNLLARILQRSRLHWFAGYCVIVSILSLFIV